MPNLKMNRWLALVTVGGMAALAAFGATLAAAATPSPQPVLNSASAADLAQDGIQLLNPTSTATVSQAAAQQTAMQAFLGSSVRETVLANFSDTHHVPAINALAWAVSLSFPSGINPTSEGPPPGHPGLKMSYLVVYIDATTGAFIEAASKG